MAEKDDAGAAAAEIPASETTAAVVAPEVKTASAVVETVETGEKPAVEPIAEDAAAAWRAQMNPGNDEKLARVINRFSTPENLARAYLAAQQKISTGDLRPKLGEKASPEEVAAYRKAEGIPEKWEDYTIPVPATRALDEVEKVVIDDFRKQAHGLNVPPKLAQSLTEWFLGVNDTQAQVMRDKAMEARRTTEDVLRVEWGPEYRSNVAAIDMLLAEKMGDAGPALLQKQFTDGTRLGDDPSMIRFLGEMARQYGGDSYNFDASVGGGGGATAGEQIKQIMGLMTDADAKKRAEYWAPETQEKLQKLYQRREREASR